jgi:hypothetical protein
VTASALGFSYDGGAGDATTVGWGATANSSEGNQALAVSLFGTANADADVSGPNKTGNTMVAVGLISPANASVQGSPSGNTYLAIDSDISSKGSERDNTVLAVGSNVGLKGNASSNFTIAGCGTSFTGQADKVEVSHGIC